MLGDLGFIVDGETTSSELILTPERGAPGRCLGMFLLYPTDKMLRCALLTRVTVDSEVVFENRHINRAQWRTQKGVYTLQTPSNNYLFGSVNVTDAFVIPSGGSTYFANSPEYWNSFFAPSSWSNTVFSPNKPTISDIPSPAEPAVEPTKRYTAEQFPLWFIADVPNGASVSITVKAMAEEPTLAGGASGGLSDDPPPTLPEDPGDIVPGLDYDLEPDEVEVDWTGTIRGLLIRIG